MECEFRVSSRTDQRSSTWDKRTTGDTRRHLRGVCKTGKILFHDKHLFNLFYIYVRDLNYTPTTLRLQSRREITYEGRRTKVVQ
jgi:hypothetical protein